MPETAYSMSEDFLRWLLRQLKRVEHGLRLPEGRPRVPTGRVTAQHSGWVCVTSTSQTAGRYPGQFALDDESTDPATITAEGAPGDVWVRSANGAALRTGVWYEARLESDRGADGVPVYVWDDSGSGGGGLSVTNFGGSTYTGITDLVGDAHGVVQFSNPLSGEADLLIQEADGSHYGIVTTGTQTLAGGKTFSSEVEAAAGLYISGNNVLRFDNGTLTSGISMGGTMALQAGDPGTPAAGAGVLELISPPAGPTGAYLFLDDQTRSLTGTGVTSDQGGVITECFGGLCTHVVYLDDGEILIGTGSGVTPAALSGDATVDGAGAVTLADVGTPGTYGQVTTDARGRVTAGATCDETHGGTHQTTYTTGDLLYASGTDTLAVLGIGLTGDRLTVAGGVPTWAAGGGLAIGDPVSGATNDYALYVDGSGNLADEAHLALVRGGTAADLSGTGPGVLWQATSGAAVAVAPADLADPGADVLLGWDDTDGTWRPIAPGSGLSYDHATHTLSASGGSVGGADTQVLYNASGVETGDAHLVWDYTAQTLSVIGSGGASAVHAADGTRAVDLCDGLFGAAITATVGAITVYVGNGGTGVNANQGSYSAILANATYAGYFTDGANSVTLADGTNAFAGTGLIDTDQAASGFSTLGSVVGRLPLYSGGSLVGYAPLYDTIT